MRDVRLTYKDDLSDLETVLNQRVILKGIKETLRAIESGKAIYMSMDADMQM